jgi:hypothetical protein
LFSTDLVPKISARLAPPSVLPAKGCPNGISLGDVLELLYVEVLYVEVVPDDIEPVFVLEVEPVPELDEPLLPPLLVLPMDDPLPPPPLPPPPPPLRLTNHREEGLDMKGRYMALGMQNRVSQDPLYSPRFFGSATATRQLVGKIHISQLQGQAHLQVPVNL